MHHRPMTREWAGQIQEWTYGAPYDFYNQPHSEEGITELMTYQAIMDGHSSRQINGTHQHKFVPLVASSSPVLFLMCLFTS
ncbi:MULTISPECIES: hypothetical protein [unclassified Exiguobacterium]|uniref:hypothetical protein n=1 Tax=unclassified Exiguobacterium TaxID=2644629 RepID=UPI001BE585CF|nr:MULTISPECIES: hypothetical protein [unclassified Exiguobacterium]